VGNLHENTEDQLNPDFPPRELMATWIRPFKMFLTEPIVLVLSLLSGFSDSPDLRIDLAIRSIITVVLVSGTNR
jgi:hypothetical protein